MGVLTTLMDKAKARRGMHTDMALGESLNRSRQVVSQWRNEDAYPDEDLIVKMAEMAGEDPGQWLVAIKAVRSDGSAAKEWAKVAKRLATTMALLLVLALPYSAIAKAQDYQQAQQAEHAAPSRHYAK